MNSSPKGLATVAFLKTKLDEGCDHLGLFEPLVLDALTYIDSPDFLADNIRAVVQSRTGVLVPVNTIQTLLGRCAKRGLVQRKGGRFFRTSKPIPDSGLDEGRIRIEAEQESLGAAFIEFATEQGVEIETTTEALSYLATFVSDNKVQVILNDPLPESPLERSSLNRKLTRVIARFITNRCLTSEALRSVLSGLTEGILLQDTLLMRDVPDAAQRFQELIVAFDTGILFAAIGLTGVANGVAAKEGLTMLRQAGARTIAFSRTVTEMRRILAIYEDRLTTIEGRLSLHPTALTQHVLTSRLTSADIRIISSTLEKRLGNIGVGILEFPKHDVRYTLDEESLARELVDVRRPDPESPRVRHDVDCISSVLTFRRGETSTSIERSVAIFCTASGTVVRNVQQWFFGQAQHGVPPIIHQAALTSIAWLKKPAVAPDLKMHELAAICIAVMRPTRKTMSKLVDNLKSLRADGSITDDETAAVVASELMEPILARLDDEFEPDSDSIQDAIERVRDSYRREATVAAEQAIAAAEQTASMARANAATAQQVADEAIRAAQAEAELAQQAAAGVIARQNELITRVDERVSRWARLVSYILFYLLVAILVVAVCLSLPGVFDAIGGTAKWIARAILIIGAVLGIISISHGVNLKDSRRVLQDWIVQRLKPFWLPDDIVDKTFNVPRLRETRPLKLISSAASQEDEHQYSLPPTIISAPEVDVPADEDRNSQ